MTCQVLTGDAAEQLKNVADGSIQLVVTSPSYDDLRTYGHGLRWDFGKFMKCAKQLERVLCIGGVICWNVNDSVVKGSESLTSCKQKIFFVEGCSLRVHDTMIWQKDNFANPETARYHQIFEYVFVLSKGKPRVFNPIYDRRNINFGKKGRYGLNTIAKRDGEKGLRRTKNFIDKEFGRRYNLWKGPTAGQQNPCSHLPHPAMMPKWLARDLISSWSIEGDTILDPFAGSGTTGQEALSAGRNAILIDLDTSLIQKLAI